mmetsp:Transcript_49110/g.106907  ORF Transcript_49110/g.106907 Transcript_49110/m.106907 type:complete len:192 (-) Transcript_49110:9-584(-)
MREVLDEISRMKAAVAQTPAVQAEAAQHACALRESTKQLLTAIRDGSGKALRQEHLGQVLGAVEASERRILDTSKEEILQATRSSRESVETLRGSVERQFREVTEAVHSRRGEVVEAVGAQLDGKLDAMKETVDLVVGALNIQGQRVDTCVTGAAQRIDDSILEWQARLDQMLSTTVPRYYGHGAYAAAER